MTAPELASIAPFRATTLAWRAPHGAMLTLVCKATYRLAPGEAVLADDQEYPYEDDNHWNDDDSRSLHAPTDMVPVKPRAEVLVVGSAFAPSKQPKRRLVARVIVGEVDKAVQVSGDRFWKPDGTLSEPVPFVKMPLRYERASGGPGTANPVGVRWDQVDGMGKTQLPNLLPLDYEPGLAPDAIDPVGFGPISPTWPMRQARLGRRADAWARRHSFDEPMPEDLDPTYFLSAPWDQQVDALRPNERIVLENLHPDHARLVTSLPGLEPRVFVERGPGAPHELALRCDTLWIDTDRAICTLCWRGQVPLDRAHEGGSGLEPLRRLVVASAMLGQRLAWSDVEPLLGRPLLGTASAMRLERGPRPETVEIVDEAADTGEFTDDDDDDGTKDELPVGMQTTPFLKTPKSPALPFVRSQQPPAAAPSSARGRDSVHDLDAFGAAARAQAAAKNAVEVKLGSTIELVVDHLVPARDEGDLPTTTVTKREVQRSAPPPRGSSPVWLPEQRPTTAARVVPASVVPPMPPIPGAPGSPGVAAPLGKRASHAPQPPPAQPPPPQQTAQPAQPSQPPQPPAMVFAQTSASAPAVTPRPAQAAPVEGSPWASNTGSRPAAREAWTRPRAPESKPSTDDPTMRSSGAVEGGVPANFSAVAASNAAAAQVPSAAKPVAPAAPSREAAPPGEARAATFVDLLWFDPDVAPRARAATA
ncbi:MAG TPA: DUF2169 domain-containing protein, partial [Byssovorax sp.]